MYDVLVVGLGAMGSATAYELALRGASVIGVDAHAPPHTLGSTHGRSRIIREAYFEHPSYVPLVQRAFERWAALERESGESLYRRTGGLSIGAPESELVAGVMRSAREHRLDVELLNRREMRDRYPAFVVEHDMVGVVEQNAGMLAPEACVRACLRLAASRGAELVTDDHVVSIARQGAAFLAKTRRREIAARRIVLCAGAWNASLAAQLGIDLPLVVTRQTMHWLAARGDARLREPAQFPVTLIDHGGERMFYTMPDVGDGIKAAIHHDSTVVRLDDVDRTIRPSDTQPVVALAERFMPAVAGPVIESVVCLYTNTPDHDFIIDLPAIAPGVVLVSACSGHGFKFASAIGEAAAQLAVDEPVEADLRHFTLDRFR